MPQKNLRLEIESIRDSGSGTKCDVLAFVDPDEAPLYRDRIALGVRDDRAKFVKALQHKMGNSLSEVSVQQLDAKLIDLSVQATTRAREQTEAKTRERETPPATMPQGQPLVFVDDEPWPDPIDGADLLDNISAVVARHAIVPTGAADAIALWVLHTYLMLVWYVSPFLTIHSPLKGCGKSTLLKIVAALVYRPISTANISTAALFRVIQQAHPTLLMDEAQAWIDDTKNELTGILQGSHCRITARVFRVEENGANKLGVVGFDTWSPKVIALVGDLPDMMMDRSVVIRMRRKRPTETITPIRERTWLEEMRPWRARLRRFADDHANTLAELNLDPPAELRDRTADNWSSLRAIAHVLGGQWPQRALDAAVALSGGTESSEDSPGLAYSLTCAAIFAELPATMHRPAISSAQLVERLNKLEDRPWADRRRGQGVSPAWVAKQLAAFDVPPPDRIRFPSGDQLRGYYNEWFAEPWERYLPVSEVSQCHNANSDGPESQVSECHTPDPVTPSKAPNSSIDTGVVTLVTDLPPKQGDGTRRPPPVNREGAVQVEEFEL